MIKIVDGSPVHVPDDARITPDLRAARAYINHFLASLQSDDPTVRAIDQQCRVGVLSETGGLEWHAVPDTEASMPFTRDQLIEMFTYHAPSDAQIEHYQAVRTAALEFASVISEHVPPSPDQSVAIRKVREAAHSANAAIALAGKY